MAELQYIALREKPALMTAAAEWFHSKWGVPTEAYLECMEAYLKRETELGWFLCMDGGRIVGGLGVIENDFHDRPDLTGYDTAFKEYKSLSGAQAVAECVAAGYSKADEVYAEWEETAADSLLDEDFTHAGLACVYLKDSANEY